MKRVLTAQGGTLTHKQDTGQLVIKAECSAHFLFGGKVLAKCRPDRQTMHGDLQSSTASVTRTATQQASQPEEATYISGEASPMSQSCKANTGRSHKAMGVSSLACSSFSPFFIALRLQYSVGTKQRSTRGWNQVL